MRKEGYAFWQVTNHLLRRWWLINYDHDRYKEIVVFTRIEDSVFMNIVEPLDPNGLNVINKFATKIRKVKDKIDFSINWNGFYDLNNDGYKEIIFGVFGGLSRQPRQLFAYNIVISD